MPAFVVLDAKSHYSLGVGATSIPALVQHAGRLGYSHLALTDDENVYGQVQFHAACRAYDIRPITGVELRVPSGPGAAPQRLLLLVRTEAGYSELCRVVTQRRSTANHTLSPPDALGALGALGDDAFLLCEDAPMLRQLVQRYGSEALRARVTRPRPGQHEPELIAAARELGVALVASSNVMDIVCSPAPLRRLLAAVHAERPVGEIALEPAETGALRSPAAMTRLFADLPEAVRETRSIAEACSFDLLALAEERPRYPEEQRELERLCQRELAALTPRRGPAYAERVTSELRVIEALGLSECLVSLAALVDRARERAIPLSLRGSAASSLVAHLLGLSAIDPIEQGLYFERFASEERRSPADVDLDVASRRREELIEWLIDARGTERTARVASVPRFQRRSAYRSGLKALGAPRQVIERFLRQLPLEELEESPAQTGTIDGLSPTANSASPQRPLPWSRHLPQPWQGQVALLEQLIGIPRRLALHPGGVVLAHPRLARALPLERTPSGVNATQYDAASLAALGGIKVDLLGNHCLDELDEVGRLRGARSGRNAPELKHIPLDDRATLARIDRAHTLGCYLLESPAQRAVLARLPVRRLEDVTHALAIVRPGPASGYAKDLFLARARGEASEPELHPALAERLRSTHGLLLFEEDILFLLATLAGVSLATAEALRVQLQERAEDTAWLARAGERFSARAAARGFPLDVAACAWSDVLRSVSYTFNKAHAATQARLAYQSAFLKEHAPLEHACAVLNHHAGLYPRRVIAADLARSGLRLLLPSLQRSGFDCSLDTLGTPPGGSAVRIGLGLVKGLRARTRERLLSAGQGFAHLPLELRQGAPDLELRAGEWRALVLTGACDSLWGLEADDYPWVHEALLGELESRPTGVLESLTRLRACVERARQRIPHGPPDLVARYRALARVQNELRYLELFVSDHPLRILRAEADRLGCVPSPALAEHVGRRVVFAAIVAATRRVPLARAEVTQFLTLEDEHGLVEARLAPAAFARLAARVSTPGPFLIQGRPLERLGVVELAIDQLQAFHERPTGDPASLAPVR